MAVRPNYAVISLISGAIVYVAVAACSGVERRSFNVAGEPSESSDAGSIDDIVDAITDPVGEAKAGPSEPEVYTENCDKVGATVGAADFIYAVHNFPGKSVVDLSSVRVIGHVTSDAGARVPVVDGLAFDSQITNAYLREGAAIALCGTSQDLWFDTVRFVLTPP